ncbi:hypothetical protein LSUB1_G002946 [Lachnellula subtilissima]|uniref:Alpha/beta hydrolase fold-3 domain-containing protein n=1 Tax=Lachnellula subtilissima TaxID=602034 RepID=A0A8H8U7P8_9HELO|nr:hypothetical protein LSUB1_G002946 [Lachnellula subtilissima]
MPEETFYSMLNSTTGSALQRGSAKQVSRAYEGCCRDHTSILEDETLPIDKSRVILGGFGAGGNLNISTAQMLELKGKIIKGVVSWYPVLDFTPSPLEKQSSRPYRHLKYIDDLKN